MANQMTVVKKDVVEQVTRKVQEFQENGEISLPTDYSPGNAMQFAWLKLQEVQDRNRKPALQVVTKSSVANALLDMVVQGLNVNKMQGYFIVYGDKLVFQRSYFGDMAVTKRVTGATSIDAYIIFEGDEVSYKLKGGKIKDFDHKQQFGNIDNTKINGAYCVIEMPDGTEHYELMTMAEIRKSWEKSQSKGTGQTHKDSPQEMAKRTVIRRACKKFINSSDDGSLVVKTFKKQDGELKEAEVAAEVNENANTEYFEADFEEVDEGPMQAFDGDDRSFDERVASGEFVRTEGNGPVHNPETEADPF